MSLLKGDPTAEYFLFDEVERPIRFSISTATDYVAKMMFRLNRSQALSGSTADPAHVCALGEYLVKMMEDRPGLSRERILDQLSREYGMDVAKEVAIFESKRFEPGQTFIEHVSAGLNTTLPRIMELGAGILT
jgi:hypothetical protein